MPPLHLTTIAARLRHARELRGVPTKVLSGKAGYSAATASNIENHPEQDVRCGTILALARVLQVHPAWLAWGIGPMEPWPEEIDRTL